MERIPFFLKRNKERNEFLFIRNLTNTVDTEFNIPNNIMLQYMRCSFLYYKTNVTQTTPLINMVILLQQE